MEKSEIDNKELRELRGREGPEEISKIVMEKIERKEREKRRRKIEESRFNGYYGNIIVEEEPYLREKYLKGKRKKKERNLIARYRCGNEMKKGQYWKEEEEGRSRICGETKENLTHVLKECKETRDEMGLEEFLNEEGKGS